MGTERGAVHVQRHKWSSAWGLCGKCGVSWSPSPTLPGAAHPEPPRPHVGEEGSLTPWFLLWDLGWLPLSPPRGLASSPRPRGPWCPRAPAPLLTSLAPQEVASGRP